MDSFHLHIVSLTDPEAKNVRQYGGKISGLAQLATADVQIPWGLGIGKQALAHFLSENGIDLAALAQTHKRGMIFLESALTEAQAWHEKIIETVQNGVMPSAVESAIAASLPDPDARFAVRSSCVVEDSSATSFAGQYVTVLNVAGLADIMKALRSCWSSQYDHRALSYAIAHRGMPVLVPSMAVLIQEMLAPEFAGVCFTEGPTPKTKEYAVVESVAGLGEALVSGERTPAHFEIARDGSFHESKAAGARGEVAPTADQVTLVAREARKIAAFFGRPQDVEWAIAGGHLYILQARPITTLGGERSARSLTGGGVAGATSPANGTSDSPSIVLRDDLHEWLITRVDPLIYRGATYLLAKQRGNGSWGVEGHAEWDCVATALVVRLLLNGRVPSTLSWSFAASGEDSLPRGINPAVQWLVEHVNADGSWGTDLWDTSQVIRTLVLSGASVEQPIVARAIRHVTERLASSTRPVEQEWAGAGFLAALVHLLHEIGHTSMLEEFGSRLKATQTADGDFPSWPDSSHGAVPSEWHTAQAITALSRCCGDDTRTIAAIQKAVSWLVSRQNPDGSWGVSGGPYAHYNTFFTSYAVIALADAGPPAAVVRGKAVRWLRGKQVASGSFGDTASSLMAMTALQETQGPLFSIELPLPFFLRIQNCLG
jgi:pyruvate,water dikinase